MSFNIIAPAHPRAIMASVYPALFFFNTCFSCLSPCQAEEMRKDGTAAWLVLVLQHSGIIIGFLIMYLMAAYGGEIDFTQA